jgi:hypothetical protein
LQKEPSNRRFARNDSVHLNPLADVSNLVCLQVRRQLGNGHMEKEVIYKGYYPYSTLIHPSIPDQLGNPVAQHPFQYLRNSDSIQNPFLLNLGSSASPNQ